MKQEDFERLKAKLGDEFEIIQDALVSIDGTIAFVRKKDIWDGVEFAEAIKTGTLITTGKIYKILNNSSRSIDIYADTQKIEDNITITCFKPSTEYDYIEQLKKEAHERFGEIKIGDKFNRDWDIKNEPKYGIGVVGDNKDTGFEYRKSNDSFMVKGTTIYREGKWATRVKERVKVEVGCGKEGHGATFSFKFRNLSEYPDFFKMEEFLAYQLEKYLNGEIE